ncbi:MAG: type II secretion system protein [Pirellulaceae bacterium]|nr:type II secretion system protein [Planctomycetales bacterium]
MTFYWLRNPAATPSRARGFTLVELLMTIMVITVLTSMVLFAMAGAQNTAKENRTRAQVARLQELVMTEYEQYESRPIPPLNPAFEAAVAAQNVATGGKLVAQMRARARLEAVRELMRMEMPSRIDDVIFDPAVLASRPALNQAYLRRINSLPGGPTSWTGDYQQAECLYMIISKIPSGDVSALEFFQQDEIGDVDGDGMPEILDGFGNPIRWLRWAPGFLSNKQSSLSGDGDPFDPMGVDARENTVLATTPPTRLAFTMYPVVFSAGPDGKEGITMDFGSSVNYGPAASGPPYPSWNASLFWNDPYRLYNDPDNGLMFMGTPLPSAPNDYLDNIDGHSTVAR